MTKSEAFFLENYAKKIISELIKNYFDYTTEKNYVC